MHAEQLTRKETISFAKIKISHTMIDKRKQKYSGKVAFPNFPE